jgi:hypothetical protein
MQENLASLTSALEKDIAAAKETTRLNILLTSSESTIVYKTLFYLLSVYPY